MRTMWMLLAAVALCAGTALAQTGTTTTTTTTGTVLVPVAGVGMSPTAPILTPTVGATATTVAACPVGVSSFPTPCAARTVQDINNRPVLLVLGTEERYAINTLGVRRLNWNDVSMNALDYTTERNPLTNSRPNASIVRHGNPYYPYINYGPVQAVAGIQERFVNTNLPANLSTESRSALSMVADRYRGLTTQQAVAMGYQPVGAYTPNVGQVYINQAAIDNRFDVMVPEAFTFDNNGRLLAAQYIVLSDLPVVAFGQPLVASPLVQGAQQLSVWLFTNNPNGLFAMQRP